MLRGSSTIFDQACRWERTLSAPFTEDVLNPEQAILGRVRTQSDSRASNASCADRMRALQCLYPA